MLGKAKVTGNTNISIINYLEGTEVKERGRKMQGGDGKCEEIVRTEGT